MIAGRGQLGEMRQKFEWPYSGGLSTGALTAGTFDSGQHAFGFLSIDLEVNLEST